jgi:hypothetical protein
VPGLTVDTSPINFPVAAPGQQAQPPQWVSITNQGTEAVTVSVAIVGGAESSGFEAQWFAQAVVNRNGAWIHTSTPINGASVEFPPGAAQPQPGQGLPPALEVSFTGPATPVPGSFTATLVVSWDGGTAQIPLSGSTAEFTVKVASTQPVEVTAGDDATVEFALTYQSSDPAPLQVTFTAETFPEGLAFTPATVTLAPVYVQPGSNPKEPPKGPLFPILVTTRTAKVSVTVTSDLTATQLGDSTGQVLVTGFGTQYVSVAFRVIPPRVKVVPATVQPIVLTPSVPAPVKLTISAPGALTNLQFEVAGSLPGGISIDWPSSAADGNIDVGLGTTSTHFTVLAPVTESQETQHLTLSLKWSAYGGMRSGTVDIKVELLPSVIVWQTPMLDLENAYGDCKGDARWTLRSDGSCNFVGSVGGGGVDFWFQMWTSSNLMINGTPSPLGVCAYGENGLNGVSWDQDFYSSLITPNWPLLLISTYHVNLSDVAKGGWWQGLLTYVAYGCLIAASA